MDSAETKFQSSDVGVGLAGAESAGTVGCFCGAEPVEHSVRSREQPTGSSCPRYRRWFSGFPRSPHVVRISLGALLKVLGELEQVHELQMTLLR
jgi:hypothetical protein